MYLKLKMFQNSSFGAQVEIYEVSYYKKRTLISQFQKKKARK